MLLTFLVLSAQGWSFWGSEKETEDLQKEVESNVEKTDFEKKEAEVEPSVNSNPQTHYTLDELNQMNREEFVRKMEEAMCKNMFKNVAKTTVEPKVKAAVVEVYYEELKEFRDDPDQDVFKLANPDLIAKDMKVSGD